MKRKQLKQPKSLTLHSLIIALSFWGTSVRLFLFAILAFAVTIVALSETSSASQFDNEIMVTLYILGAFFVLDFGYVMVARTYPVVRQWLDMLLLIASDIFLAALYIIPKVTISQSVVLSSDPLIFAVFVPLVVLSSRMLVGLLVSSRK